MDLHTLFTYVALVGMILGILIMLAIFGMLVYVVFFRGRGSPTRPAASDSTSSPAANSRSEVEPA